MNEKLNPIGQEAPLIDKAGKPYSSMEELTRANIMYENIYTQNILPNIDTNKVSQEALDSFDIETHHKNR